MSNPRISRDTSYTRRRLGQPVSQLTFFDRHYRSLHHIGVLLGISLFFGPFVYKFLNPPPVEEVKYSSGSPRPNYTAIEKELDKWRS